MSGGRSCPFRWGPRPFSSCWVESMSGDRCSTVRRLGFCGTVRGGAIKKIYRYSPSDSVNEIEFDTLLRKTINSTSDFDLLELGLVLT
jgi:hypothetical protein